jgi:hypothetical protein
MASKCTGRDNTGCVSELTIEFLVRCGETVEFRERYGNILPFFGGTLPCARVLQELTPYKS